MCLITNAYTEDNTAILSACSNWRKHYVLPCDLPLFMDDKCLHYSPNIAITG